MQWELSVIVIIVASFSSFTEGDSDNVESVSRTVREANIHDVNVHVSIVPPRLPRPRIFGRLGGGRRIAIGPRRDQKRRQLVCYDVIGCFHTARNRVLPDPPDYLDTNFLLFTPSNRDAPQTLEYDRWESLNESNFDPSRPTKFIIHGYRSSPVNHKPLKMKDIFLDMGDYNVILADWKVGAQRGYLKAAVNTEMVGRQVAYLIQQMVKAGADPKDVHLVGVSLGAHVSGFAGEALKSRGIALGKITGLDPAGFLFQMLPGGVGLDKTDADFVEVIHTFGGSLVNGKMGYQKSIAHVDYYPNGGSGQPACDGDPGNALDVLISVSDFQTSVCSHLRSVDLYMEALISECRFVGIPCHGARNFDTDFAHGSCFTCHGSFCGTMGHDTRNSTARGALFLMTKDKSPFCGEHYRATVEISEETLLTKGRLYLDINFNGTEVKFEMTSRSNEVIQGGDELNSMIAADEGLLRDLENGTASASLSFQPDFTLKLIGGPNHIFFNAVSVMDLDGNGLYYCGNNTVLHDDLEKSVDMIQFELQSTPC